MTLVKNALRPFFLAFLIIAVVVSSSSLTPNPVSASPTSLQKAQNILDEMTPEERVGQLFLVSFEGIDVSETSQIYDLIANYHIGGVILQRKNDNFTGPDNTAVEAHRLISSLQDIEWQAAQTTADAPSTDAGIYVPLFVAISQEGDEYPNDQLINDLTPLPNQMAIGATWNTDLAQQVGRVMGEELSALGFNLFIGPSLDVLDVYRTEGEDLGTRTFGGDPYWVGEMGKAYIAGLHEGSDTRMAVIAKNFPGRGSSDRHPEEEVATVRKSLEQLKQIELAPFASVTGNAPSVETTTDGLLLSHIRYQGFQGNIRATTRPISFDPTALELVLNLDEFRGWRDDGGILVSDSLGSQAVRKFYDPSGQIFDARQVARNAFIAGNDLLYIDNFIATGDPDEYTTIVRTLELFTQKYREDSAFAEKVDASVLRLLNLKYRLYTDFSIEDVTPLEDNLSEIGTHQTVTFQVAQEAATLINPAASELSISLPTSPGLNERIIFFTDVTKYRQCSTCPEQVVLPTDKLQSEVIRLYGLQAGGQIAQTRLSSYSFVELTNLLNGLEMENSLESDLENAQWVVVAMQNIDSQRPESQAFIRLLSERPDLLSEKRVILFSFNAPYYLDATDISKVTAYYGVYSKLSSFAEVAVRLLFQEMVPTGSLPVSVPGIEYDLIVATSPDPNQVIPLIVDTDELELLTTVISETPTDTTPEPTPEYTFMLGDILPIRTGTIYDHNGHPVPDGTVVRFQFTNENESLTSFQLDATTSGGTARINYAIESIGNLQIQASSDPAFTSETLLINISEGEAAAVTVIAPTDQPSSTPEPTATQPLPSPTAVITEIAETQGTPAGIKWLISMGLIWACAAGMYYYGRNRFSIRWGVRWGLLAASTGILAYILLALFPSNADNWFSKMGLAGTMMVVFVGVVCGCVGGWLWRKLLETRPAPSKPLNKKEV